MPTFIGGSVANRVAGGGTGFGDEGSILVNFPIAAAEYLSNWQQVADTLEFANAWSISMWGKPELDAGGVLKHLVDFRGGSTSRIRLGISDGATPFFFAILQDDGGSIFKLYRYENAVAASTWSHWVVTWNGSALILYYNGAANTPTLQQIDNAGTMANDVGNIGLGVDVDDLVNSGGTIVDNTWTGNIGHVGVWSTAIDEAAAAQIFAGKHAMDLSVNSGNYTFSGDLEHWYRPGFDSIGNLDEAGNDHFTDNTVTDSNIVQDAPA